MFSKLLKHDSRAVFKYWWIGAVASLLIAVFGGVCIQIVDIDYTTYEVIPVLGTIGIIFSAIGIILLPVLTEILILVRYYKHFFSDEGYLTFTLPVKKTSLLDSKIATALIFSVVTSLIVIFDVLTMLAVGIPEEFFNPWTWDSIFETISEFYDFLGFYGVPYTVLAVLILLVSVIAQALVVFACITLASSIAKKHKILLAIGIYYGFNMAVSMLMQIMSYGGISTVLSLIESLDQTNAVMAGMFILIGVLGIDIVVIGGLYLLMLYLLDKRLNLE